MPAVGTVNFYILLYFCLNSAHFETFHSQVEGLVFKKDVVFKK